MGGAALGSAVASATTSAVQAILARGAAKTSRRHQEKGSKISFGRQVRLRGTAYQATVKDLKAAGLNPILAVGGPTSTPTSAMAASATADTSNVTTSGVKAAEAIARFRQLQSQLKTDKTTRKLQESAALKAEADAHSAVALTNKIKVETQLLKTDIPGAEAKMSLDKTEAGGYLRVFNRFMGSLFGNSPSNARSRD